MKKKRMKYLSIALCATTVLGLSAFNTSAFADGGTVDITYNNNKVSNADVREVTKASDFYSVTYDGETFNGVFPGAMPAGNWIYPFKNQEDYTKDDDFWSFRFNRAGAWSTVKDAVSADNATSDDRQTRINYWKQIAPKLYKGGQIIPQSLIDEISANPDTKVYEQWANYLDLSGFQTYFDKKETGEGRANIRFNDSDSEYESSDTALPLDHTNTFKAKAFLDNWDIANSLWVLWARMDKIETWSGNISAYFDARVKFNNSIDVVFSSAWVIPDNAKLAENGISAATEIEVPRIDGNTGHTIPDTVTKAYKFTFDTTNMPVVEIDGKRYYHFNLPVTIRPRKDFFQMSFQEFMEPFVLSVGDDFDKGVNALVTPESYNVIASGDDPFIQFKGDVSLNISGSGESFTFHSVPADEYAKLYPTGLMDVSFKEYKNGAVVESSAIRDTETLEGRVARTGEGYEDDPLNYTDAIDLYNTDASAPEAAAQSGEKKKFLSSPYVIPGYRYVGYQINPTKKLQINEDGVTGEYVAEGETSTKVGTSENPAFLSDPSFGLGEWGSVTLLYEKKPGHITVKYVDENGNEIASADGLPKQFEGEIGTKYEIDPKGPAIEGYEFSDYDPDSFEFTGTYKEDNEQEGYFDNGTVTYKYTKKNIPPTLTVADKTIKQGDQLDLRTLITKASDPEDGDLTDQVIIKDKGGFDAGKPGTYTIVYEVKDSKGATVTATAKVTVEEKKAVVKDDKPKNDDRANDKNTQKENKPDKEGAAPMTGDAGSFELYTVVLLMAVCGLAGAVVLKRRKMM